MINIISKERDFDDPRRMGAIYKWEQNLQRSWEVVTEDKEGNIHVERNKQGNRSSKDSTQREYLDRDRLSCIRRGLIRYLVGMRMRFSCISCFH
jgi:hypothetical protein